MTVYSKAARTQDLILDTAMRLFAQDGFAETSMDAIAAAAAVAKGTLYYHYQSKEGILDAILERYRGTMEARLAAVEADARLDALGKLGAFVAEMRAVNAATFSVLHRVRYIDIHHKTLGIKIRYFTPYLARLFEAGNRDGSFHVAYPTEFAEFLLASAQILLDPENGTQMFPRRLKAMRALLASFLEIPPERAGRLLKPLWPSKPAAKE